MNDNIEAEKILAAEVLPNGITVTFYDLSRNVAADRWLIRVQCEAVFEAGAELFARIHDEELAAAMQVDCAGRVRHHLGRERNFVDAREKDAVLGDLFSQLHENAIAYMGGELFLQKLFDRKVDEFRVKYLMRKEIERQEALEDDDGPADFSACFRDPVAKRPE
jgi:hypothetical protein